MAERRVAEIVRQRHRLGQILVEPQRPGDRAGHLADFERMGQPGAEMLALVMEEHLGLVLQAPEGGRMDDPVAVALEFRARRAGAGVDRAGRGSAPDRRHRARVRSSSSRALFIVIRRY